MHIASQVYDLVDKHIRELDDDLKGFAAEVDGEAQSLGLGEQDTACDRLGWGGGARVRGGSGAAAAAAAAGGGGAGGQQGRQKRKTAGRRKGGEAGAGLPGPRAAACMSHSVQQCHNALKHAWQSGDGPKTLPCMPCWLLGCQAVLCHLTPSLTDSACHVACVCLSPLCLQPPPATPRLQQQRQRLAATCSLMQQLMRHSRATACARMYHMARWWHATTQTAPSNGSTLHVWV